MPLVRGGLKIDIAILMACHNRKLITKRCIDSIIRANELFHWNLKLFVVDDGSTDGTKEVLINSHLNSQVILGSGDWYWAKSMAFAESFVPDNFQGKLWLNNDVELLPDALQKLGHFMAAFPSSIIVGQLLDPISNSISYGGLKQIGKLKNSFKVAASKGVEDGFQTFCGNFAYIPMSISRKLGPIDGNFSHGFADLDYGLRATKASVNILVPPTYFGYCASNPLPGDSTLRKRLAHLLSEKRGTPLKSQIKFFRRHGGVEWPIYVIYPFISALLGTNSRGETRVLGRLKSMLNRFL